MTSVSSATVLRNSLKTVRTWRNMTQEQLARRTGVSRQTILGIEMGRSTPSVFLAYRIAAVLNVPVTDVFTVDSAPQQPPSGG